MALVLFSLLILPLGADSGAEREALAAATAWLELVDSGKYGESWDEAASLFKSQIPREQWIGVVKSVRGPLGKFIARRLKSSHYTTTAPGAPDGEYVMLQFDSSFEHKKAAVETVTPMKEKDGKWRVSGYFIR